MGSLIYHSNEKSTELCRKTSECGCHLEFSAELHPATKMKTTVWMTAVSPGAITSPLCARWEESSWHGTRSQATPELRGCSAQIWVQQHNPEMTLRGVAQPQLRGSLTQLPSLFILQKCQLLSQSFLHKHFISNSSRWSAVLGSDGATWTGSPALRTHNPPKCTSERAGVSSGLLTPYPQTQVSAWLITGLQKYLSRKWMDGWMDGCLVGWLV